MADCRDLGPEHRPHLEAFQCARDGEPWAREVETGIRTEMAGLLDRRSHYKAIGLWEGDELVAVCAWEPLLMTADRWTIITLAVHLDHRRNRYAWTLKRKVLERAAAAGVRVVVSKVRLDNGPMLELNRRLKAKRRPDHESGYCWCTITV